MSTVASLRIENDMHLLMKELQAQKSSFTLATRDVYSGMNAASNAMQEIVSQHEEAKKAFSSVGSSLNEAFKSYRQSHNAFTEAIQSIQGPSYLETIKTFHERYSVARQLAQMKIAPEINAFQKALRDFRPAGDVLRMLQKDFAVFEDYEPFRVVRPELWDIIEKYERLDNIDAYTAEQAVDEVTVHLEISITQAKTPVELNLLLTVVFPLVLTFVSMLHAQILSTQTTAQIAAFERNMEERFDGLQGELRAPKEQIKEKVFYRVKRAVWLTEEKRFHGTQIMLLMPGQEVEVIEDDRKWIRVMAYDPDTEHTQVGWVLKKYLKRMPPSGAWPESGATDL